MKTDPFRPWFIAAFLAGSLVLVGCGGSNEEEAWVEPPVEESTEMVEAESTDSEEGESTTDTFVIQVDSSIPASPEQYDEAMRARNYTQAADVILRMNAQNVEGANTLDRMRQLQDEVARAAGSGDRQALQAAEMLRRIGRMPGPGAGGQ
jgi:hypothetical protein